MASRKSEHEIEVEHKAETLPSGQPNTFMPVPGARYRSKVTTRLLAGSTVSTMDLEVMPTHHSAIPGNAPISCNDAASLEHVWATKLFVLQACSRLPPPPCVLSDVASSGNPQTRPRVKSFHLSTGCSPFYIIAIR